MGYEIRDYLSRTVVEFDWVDLRSEEECQEALDVSDFESVSFPVVEMPGGERLFAPEIRDIAQRLGWVTSPRYTEYDVSIYGGGPSGLSAAVYAARKGFALSLSSATRSADRRGPAR